MKMKINFLQDKDFFKATPVDMSLHREMDKVYLESGNTPTSKRGQRLFKELQKLLDRYPNSTRLFNNLSRIRLSAISKTIACVCQ